MRILIVHREYPPETGWGGIATFNYHLAHGLKEIGHEVTVLSFNYTEPSDTIKEGIRVVRVTSYWNVLPWNASMFLYFYLYQLKIWRTFKQLNKANRFDVVDCADHLGEGFGIIRSGIIPTTLRFYSPWSWIAAQSLNLKERWYDINGIKWLESSSIFGSHCLTSPSKDLADRVTDFFEIKKPIEIIGNPIDINRFSPMDILPSEPVKILFVGRLEPRKGCDILAKAIPHVCREVSNVEFTFLGSDCPSKTSPSTKEELKAFLGSKDVLKWVNFMDRVDLLDLPKIYNSAHIVVVPSRYDNSPYVCQEAMACGRAVIGTTAGGMPEYMDYGKAGMLVQPEDPVALARAITTLIKNSDLRNRLGEAARKRVVEQYDRKVIARRTCDLYLKAIASHQS